MAVAMLLLGVAFAKQADAQMTIQAPGSQPSGLAYDGASLFVSDQGGFRTIFKLNPTTGAVMGSFLAPSPGGFDGRGNPNDLAFDGNNHLFIVDIGGNSGPVGRVYEVDTGGTTIFNSFPLPFRGGAIAFDGVNLYVSDFDGGGVLVTNRSGVPIRTFSSGLRPAGMAFDSLNKLIWVISEFDKKISQITTDGRLIRSCDGPREPGAQGLGGVTIVGSRLYVAGVSDPVSVPPSRPGTIFILDPSSLQCSPPLVPPITPFASFAAKLEIELGRAKGDKFELNATVKPGSSSDGIHPLTEDVSFHIGTFSTTIPAGSFQQDKKGKHADKEGEKDKEAQFKFEGSINGVALEVTIQPLFGGLFAFKAEGKGANLTGTGNPVTVKLTIGDDGGSTTVRTEHD